MACGSCGGRSAATTEYQAIYSDGTSATFATRHEARLAVAAKGGGGSIKPVQKAAPPAQTK